MAGGTKRFLDIEMALRWAYRDELPKRQGGGSISGVGLPAISPMFRVAVDGGSVRDNRHDEARLPPAAGDAPDEDALTIERSVKALHGYAGWEFAGVGTDPAGLAIGMEWACGIRRDGDGNGPPAAIDLAGIVIEAVGMMAGTVACHARAGTRPKFTLTRPAPEPVIGPNGKPKVLVDEQRGCRDAFGRDIIEVITVPAPAVRKDVYRERAYCPLRYVPSFAMIVAERAEWAAWRAGLGILHLELEGRLDGIAVLPPAAPWRPWARDRDGHGRPPELFLGLRDEPFRRETREQAAIKRRAGQRRAMDRRDDETPDEHAVTRRRRL